MPQVRFTQHPKLPKDWGDKPYKKDWVGNLTQDEADRWVRRGVAEIISENKVVIHASAADPESAKSSDEKVRLVNENLQKENEAKAEAAAAEAKAKAASAAIVSGATLASPRK